MDDFLSGRGYEFDIAAQSRYLYLMEELHCGLIKRV